MPWGEPDDPAQAVNAVASVNAQEDELIIPTHEADDDWGVAQEHVAPTHQETAINQEAAEFHEAVIVQETALACEINQEAGASTGQVIEAAADEEEPIFSDRIETEVPVLSDQLDSQSPSNMTASASPESFIEQYQANKKPPATTVTPAESVADNSEAPAQIHKKFSRYTISGVPAYEPGMVTLDAPDLGRMFLNWLRINMLSKTIQMNCPEALVHIMEDCVLLLAPGIFKNFLQVHGVGRPEDLEKNHKRLSEKFQRLKLHIKTQTQPSINIHRVYAVGKNRASKLNGWKIPLNIIYSDGHEIPECNRFLRSTPNF